MLGIRAAGLLMIGLGLPVLKPLFGLVRVYGVATTETGEDAGWSWPALMHALQNKAVVVTIVSTIGPSLAFIAIGMYFLRCDPSGFVRGGRRSP